MGLVQTLISPVWGFVFDNCRFRDIRKLIQVSSKFEKIEIKEFEEKSAGLMFQFVNPIVYGVCIKSEN